MTENDDKLLTDFFAGNRQEIPDNGFTRRVMRHLPDRTRPDFTSMGYVLLHAGISAVLRLRRFATSAGYAS